MLKNLINKIYTKELLLYFLLSYSLFYFAYKYFTPDLAYSDFYSYYHLYKDMDIESVETPFNTRLISSSLVYAFNQLGIFYDTKIVFKNPNIDQHVYFSAMFVNYLCVVLTCMVIYTMCANYFKNKLFSFLIGASYLLGFGTLLFCINPLTDAFSIFLMSIIFKAYIEKSKMIYPLLLIAVFQREYIFMVMALIAIVDGWMDKQNLKKYGGIIIISVFCFIVYVFLRKTLFYTPEYESQLDFSKYLMRLFSPMNNMGEFFRQNILIQNILGIYFLICIYKYIKKEAIELKNLWIAILLLLQINIVSLMAFLGNNCGRYFYMTTPVLLFYIAVELFPLYKKVQAN